MAKMFLSETAARKYFARLDEWHDGSKECKSNWQEEPLQCECCHRWSGSAEYYGDAGGWVGALCLFDEDGQQVTELESVCTDCSERKIKTFRTRNAAIKSIGR